MPGPKIGLPPRASLARGVYAPASPLRSTRWGGRRSCLAADGRVSSGLRTRCPCGAAAARSRSYARVSSSRHASRDIPECLAPHAGTLWIEPVLRPLKRRPRLHDEAVPLQQLIATPLELYDKVTNYCRVEDPLDDALDQIADAP